MPDILSAFGVAVHFAEWMTPVAGAPATMASNAGEADKHLEARNFAEAERYLILAAADADKRGVAPGKRIRLMLATAEAQRQQSKFEEAERTARKALELAANTRHPSSYARALDVLAEIFHDLERFDAMEKVVLEAIRVENSLQRPDPQLIAERVRRLGLVRYRNGDSARAIATIEKAVSLNEQIYGEEHPETADRLTELGSLYHAQANYEEAQQRFARALRIHRATLGHDAHEVLQDLYNLGAAYAEAGDVDQAAEQYERALMMRERQVGGDLEDFAELQFHLAALYFDWGRLPRSRELLAEAIGTFQRKKGPRLAVALETMGYIDEHSGRFRDALDMMTRAGKVWESCGEAHTHQRIANMEHRAELLDHAHKNRDAEYLRRQLTELAEAASAT